MAGMSSSTPSPGNGGANTGAESDCAKPGSRCNPIVGEVPVRAAGQTTPPITEPLAAAFSQAEVQDWVWCSRSAAATVTEFFLIRPPGQIPWVRPGLAAAALRTFGGLTPAAVSPTSRPCRTPATSPGWAPRFECSPDKHTGPREGDDYAYAAPAASRPPLTSHCTKGFL